MKDCDQLLEWLDSPAHSDQLAAHLSGCPECSKTAALFGNLGDHLAPHGLHEEPDPDFAARVAAHIFAQTTVSQRIVEWCKKKVDHLLRPNAVSALLDIKRRKQPLVQLRILPLLLLYLLPGFYFAQFVPDLFQFYIMSCLGLLVVAIPVYIIESESGLLKSLYRGRCLEELVTSGVSSAVVVDTLAWHCLKRIVPLALGTSLLLCPSTAYYTVHNRVGIRMVQWITGMALWVPYLVLALLGGSYAYQAVIAGPRRQSRQTVLFYVGLSIFTVGYFVSSFYALLFAEGFRERLLPDLLLVALADGTLAALSLLGLRTLAVKRFVSSSAGEETAVTSQRKARSWMVAHKGANPILAREIARRGMPWTSILIAIPWCLWALQNPMGNRIDALARFDYQLLLQAAVGVLMFGYTASAVVTQERQHGTWDALLQTRLTSREFVSGWLGSLYRNIAWWLLPVFPTAAYVGWYWGPTSWPEPNNEFARIWGLAFGAAAVATLLVAARAAAGVGLALALEEDSPRPGTTAVRRLLGKLCLSALQYGILVVATQMAFDNFTWVRSVEGHTSMIVRFVAMPWACLLVVAAGWLVASEFDLRALLRSPSLNQMAPLAAKPWWLNPMWIGIGSTILADHSEVNAFPPAMAVFGLAWGAAACWALQPLSARLLQSPKGIGDWMGRLLLGGVAMTGPMLIYKWTLPYQAALSLSGYWPSPTKSSPNGLGYGACWAWSLLAMLIWSLFQTFRDWGKPVQPKVPGLRRFALRAAGAALVTTLGSLGGHAWLEHNFTLTAAQLSEFQAWAHRPAPPAGAESKVPVYPFVGAAWCDERVLTQEYRDLVKSNCQVERGNTVLEDELRCAAKVEESRGHREISAQYYGLLLNLMDLRQPEQVALFLTAAHLTLDQLKHLDQDIELRYPEIRHQAYARLEFDIHNPYRLRLLRGLGLVHYDEVEEPTWLHQYRMYHTLRFWKEHLATQDPSATTHDPYFGLEAGSIFSTTSYRRLQAFQLAVELQKCLVTDGRYPAAAPKLTSHPLLSKEFTYWSKGNQCAFVVIGVGNFELEGEK